jgi:hypothetical protein
MIGADGEVASDVAPRFMSLRRWAKVSGFGYSWARRIVRRTIDPLPTRRIGRRIWVDLVATEEWLLRQGPDETDLPAVVDEIVAAVLGGRRQLLRPIRRRRGRQ